MSFREIAYVKLTKEEQKKALDIIGIGNLTFRKWSKYFPFKKLSFVRNLILNGDKNPCYKGSQLIPSERLQEFQNDLPLIIAIRNQKFKELRNRSAEQTIMEGFARLVGKIVFKWFRKNNSQGLSIEDFYQEAYIAVIDSIYCWNPTKNASMMTIIYTILRNRMSNFVNIKGHMLCPLTNSDLKLRNRYEKQKQQMGFNANFSEICESLNLSDSEISSLMATFTTVEGSHQQNDESDVIDYTEYRVNIDDDNNSFEFEQEEYFQHISSAAKLTSLEQIVLKAAMNPFSGWQSNLAKLLVNPKNNKPYTRMYIGVVLQSGREKVANYLKENE